MPNARALPRWWASQREPEGVPPMDVASWPSARCLGPVRHGADLWPPHVVELGALVVPAYY